MSSFSAVAALGPVPEEKSGLAGPVNSLQSTQGN